MYLRWRSSPQKCKWSNEKKDTFINSLDLLSVLELDHKMSDILSMDCAKVNQTNIDSLVENCNKILLDAASESDMFFTTKHKKTTVKKIKKPWFNRFFFFFFFFFGFSFTSLSSFFTHIEMNQSVGGAKTGVPGEKPPCGLSHI